MTSHYVLTLNGAAQRLTTALGIAEDVAVSAIWFQPNAANNGIIYIGTTSSVSSSSYGVRLEIPVSTIPSAPFNPGEFTRLPNRFTSPLRLGDFWVLGTSSDKLHLLVLDFSSAV